MSTEKTPTPPASCARRRRVSESRSAASARACAPISALTPNQRTTRPEASRRGTIRVRNGRNTPSAPRRGKTISNGAPVAIEAVQTAMTRGSSAGSWTLCQPQPAMASWVLPQ